MNKTAHFFILILFVCPIIMYGQEKVSDSIYLDPVIVVATRNESALHNIPMRGVVLIPSPNNSFTNGDIDDQLYQASNVYIDRRSGIFSKNASVSLRGLNGSTRTLVLFNGVPINKTDGGGVNWNRINPEIIDRIEVVKGPGSSLYGFNAMGGVVNIISRKPMSKNEFSASTWIGDYNSKGASMYYGNRNKIDTGFYYSVDGFSRLGDGYIAEPDSTRDSTNAKLYVKDYAARFMCGYHFSAKTFLEAEYAHSYNESGDGTQIYDPKGAYYSYTSENGRIAFSSKLGSMGTLNVLVSFQRENYIYQKENFKKSKLPPYEVTAYNLTLTNAIRDDYGINLWHQLSLNSHHSLTYGIEIRQGLSDGTELWFTSTDTMKTDGKLSNYGAYIQHDAHFFNNRMRWISAIRFDAVNFFDGSYQISSPSASNELLHYYNTNYNAKSWQGVSPRTGINYQFSESMSGYLNFSAGFRPPMLDDLINNRSITKGFKLANPSLKPETIYNIEVGSSIKIKSLMVFEPSIYYMQGFDFNYFIATGDTIWGENKPKPVLQRDNIAQATIFGAEAALRFYLNPQISGYLNYSYNHSMIGKYERKTESDLNLSGKILTEVPYQMASAGIVWQHKIITIYSSFNYTGSTFSDDENLVKLKDFYSINLKLSLKINKNFDIWVQGQNITNQIYINNKGQKGLGRFVSAGIRFRR